MVDSNTDNIDIVVEKIAYRVNSKDEIYSLTNATTGVWKALQETEKPTADKPKEEDKPKIDDKHKGDDSNCTPIEAEAVYTAGYPATVPTLLRIGNGGAGQVGLLKGLRSLSLHLVLTNSQ